MTRGEAPRRSRRAARTTGLLLAALVAAAPGCAGLPGLVTGAFTGLIDAPAQVYRYNRGEFHRNPIYWPWNLAFFSPVGMFFGPLAGLGKGIALDVEWFLNEVSYEEVFTTYRDMSIWRPYTIHW